MLVLEFDTLPEAQTALAVIDQIAAAWWSSKGYSVENNELIGRNAKTGVDNPDKTRTKTWAEIQETADGKFYFYSLSNKSCFCDWRNYLPECIVLPEDKEFVPVEDELEIEEELIEEV